MFRGAVEVKNRSDSLFVLSIVGLHSVETTDKASRVSDHFKNLHAVNILYNKKKIIREFLSFKDWVFVLVCEQTLYLLASLIPKVSSVSWSIYSSLLFWLSSIFLINWSVVILNRSLLGLIYRRNTPDLNGAIWGTWQKLLLINHYDTVDRWLMISLVVSS